MICELTVQELQRMWEPSRFTYDVNDVVPQTQPPSKRAKLSPLAAFAAEVCVTTDEAPACSASYIPAASLNANVTSALNGRLKPVQSN